MRRGGVLILLIGLILIVGAGALFFFLQPGALGTQPIGPTLLPTEDVGVDIVVAKVDIPANTVITDVVTLLETRTVRSSEHRAAEEFTNLDDVEGRLTTRAFRAGDPIVRSGLTDAGLSQQIPTQEPDRPARDKAYPFRVNSLTGVADQIKPGDFVDVVATFRFPRVVSLPTERRLEEQAGQQVQVTVRERTEPELTTTKTIVQRAQVLRIFRPPVAEGTPGAEGAQQPQQQPQQSGPPATDASGRPVQQGEAQQQQQQPGAPGTLTQGEWVLLLAMNNQEVELMEFAQRTEARVSLVLRGAGDTAFEPTIGATFDLLVSEFGVPLPRPVPPRVISEQEALVAEPTITPAPTRVP